MEHCIYYLLGVITVAGFTDASSMKGTTTPFLLITFIFRAANVDVIKFFK